MGLKSSTQKEKEKKRIGNICGQHESLKNSFIKNLSRWVKMCIMEGVSLIDLVGWA